MTEDERVRAALYELLDPLSPGYAEISIGYLAEQAANEIRAWRIQANQQQTGRRRCRIPEHRKQIKVMQKWALFLQTRHSEMYHRLRSAELEVQKLTLELHIERKRLGEASGITR